MQLTGQADFWHPTADQALADRVHARRLDSSAQDPGAAGLEDGVERGGEVRSAVADEELNVPEPLVEGESDVTSLLDRPFAGGVGGNAAQMHPAGFMLDEHQDIQSLQQHRVHVEEVNGEDPGGLGVQELSPGRACAMGAGSMPAARRISQTVEGATVTPSFVTSPWIRRYPRSRFANSPKDQVSGRDIILGTHRPARPEPIGERPRSPSRLSPPYDRARPPHLGHDRSRAARYWGFVKNASTCV
jgi:hypothetical protein